MGNRIFSKHTAELFPGIFCVFLRKDVKRISIKVKAGGEVVVSYPARESAANAMAFARRNEEWIKRTVEKMKSKAVVKEDPFTLAERREFVAQLERIFEKYELQMGLRASAVTVRLMKTRWGSCHPVSRRISINLRLARKPQECTEYVVVHELAHITHPNHSECFWQLVERHFPDHRRVRALLRSS